MCEQCELKSKTTEVRAVFGRFPNTGIKVFSHENKLFTAAINFTNKDHSQVLITFDCQSTISEIAAVMDLMNYLYSDEGFNSLGKIYLERS